jgi:hypothetical protein
MTYIIIGIIVVFIILYQIGKSQQKSEKNKSVSFNVQTNSSTKSEDDSKWEIVHRKTERWTELGFGDGDDFPGYGRLYEREFKVWYCEVGSKEIKDERIIQDRFPLHYEPENSKEITGEGVYLDRLENSKGYESLYTGLDNKNRKRWYFALIKTTPTWIETERAIETEDEKENVIEEINVPDGWVLVRRKSKEWKENGFGDGEYFPGYGKIYERTFEVWYCNIGSKEKIAQQDFIDKAILNFYNGICGDLGELKGKGLDFDSLDRKQGYKTLLTTVDNKNRKRWYFGLKETKPTYIYTESAE